MKKLMLVAAMLAMTALVAIAPVLAENGSIVPEQTQGEAASVEAADPAPSQEVVPPAAPSGKAPLEGAPSEQEPVKEVVPPADPGEETIIPVESVGGTPAPADTGEETVIPVGSAEETTTPVVSVEETITTPETTTPLAVEEQPVDIGDGPQQITGNQEAGSGDLDEEADDQEAENQRKDNNDAGSGTRDQSDDASDDEDENDEDKNDEDKNDEDENDEDENDENGNDENGNDEDENDEDENDGVEQDIGQDADSGDVDQSVDVVNTGDYVNQCVAVLQAANTGNSQNAQGVAQDDSEAEDIGADGNDISISPQIIQDCRQIILQVVMARESSGDRVVGLRDRAAIIEKIYASRPGVGAARLARTAIVSSRAGQVRAGQVGTGQVRAGQVGTGQVRAGQVRAGQVRAVRSGGGQTRVSLLSRGGSGQQAGRLRALPRTGGFSPTDAALLGLSGGALITAGGLLVRRTYR